MRLEYFQLIDRIIDLDLSGRTIRCEANVPTESTVFEGHFPGFPLMPGVLLTESMAQTSGWLLIAMQRFTRMPFLAAIKEAKFRNFVTPGRTMIVTATLEHDGSGYAITKTKVEINGTRTCDAVLTLRTIDFPNAEIAGYMKDFAKKIGFPFDTVGL